jgi:hypothetical protein
VYGCRKLQPILSAWGCLIRIYPVAMLCPYVSGEGGLLAELAFAELAGEWHFSSVQAHMFLEMDFLAEGSIALGALECTNIFVLADVASQVAGCRERLVACRAYVCSSLLSLLPYHTLHAVYVILRISSCARVHHATILYRMHRHHIRLLNLDGWHGMHHRHASLNVGSPLLGRGISHLHVLWRHRRLCNHARVRSHVSLVVRGGVVAVIGVHRRHLHWVTLHHLLLV